MSGTRRFLNWLFGTHTAAPPRRTEVAPAFDPLEGRAVPSSTGIPAEPSGTGAVPALRAGIDPIAPASGTIGRASSPG
ncbi:MAG: hypothetical protein J0I06_21880, partial [Planctomycetes bacterium]|nr:hypothetical protein [Planctomycetota bacterium]